MVEQLSATPLRGRNRVRYETMIGSLQRNLGDTGGNAGTVLADTLGQLPYPLAQLSR